MMEAEAYCEKSVSFYYVRWRHTKKAKKKSRRLFETAVRRKFFEVY
jgi:hypothetical protein